MNLRHTQILGLAIAGLLVGAVDSVALGQGCEAEPAWLPTAGTYFTSEDCPWADLQGWDYFFLEDFEDGELDTPGLAIYAQHGYVRGPSEFTDSVDGDDGVLDGFGCDGHSYHAELVEPATCTLALIVFNEGELEELPNYAGFVWTDGLAGSVLEVTVFDTEGDVAASVEFGFGNDVYQGSTEEDRFIGLNYADGIRSMILKTSMGGLEIDHVQFGSMPECGADVNDDRNVDLLDLLMLLDEWGDTPCAPADIDGDGDVGMMDLLGLMAAWGSCF